jgi:hypothetical protein
MKVRLYKPHTHAETRYEPGPEGIELDVEKHDAEFMKSVGVLDKPSASEPPASTAN